jgi:hypothetical protein
MRLSVYESLNLISNSNDAQPYIQLQPHIQLLVSYDPCVVLLFMVQSSIHVLEPALLAAQLSHMWPHTQELVRARITIRALEEELSLARASDGPDSTAER